MAITLHFLFIILLKISIGREKTNKKIIYSKRNTRKQKKKPLVGISNINN